MPKHLVIVESPSKAKTISRYLGPDYEVKASVGHVRDLPKKELGIDVEQSFQPTYEVIAGKAKTLAELRAAARKADRVLLATDPDREGEAIAWHVQIGADLDTSRIDRVSFNQVTKAAVRDAVAHPRAIDMNLVDAQQARRALDRLVGYKISPVLSRAIRGGWWARRPLSAGRVQSVALRIVVEREREILAFVPVEFWTIDVDLCRRIGKHERFRARLHKIAGEDPVLESQHVVDPILKILSQATYTVSQAKPGQRRRNPNPPFVTSTLQAEASGRLSLSPRQTMRLAQQLYEGIDLEGERVGLITYMRTDSTHVAPEAQQEAQEYITQTWGADYAPGKPPIYSSRAANAQEAHEAIRPTSVLRTPDVVRKHLDRQQLRLYELIWRRFLASQMTPAVYDTLTVDILAAKEYMFRATGRTLIFPGFLVVYQEGEEEQDQALPPLTVREVVDLVELLPEQHFTQPPPRYSESSLVRELEANGVGRPSTYASIVSIIQERKYVAKDKGRLSPTMLGMIVCDSLVGTFPDIMDTGYTASMEDQLDQIAAGGLSYREMMAGFWDGFSPTLDAAKDIMPAAARQAMWNGLPESLHGRTCPTCGQPLQVRLSDGGLFLGCTSYPKCRYVLDLSDPEHPAEPPKQEDTFAEGESCTKCGGRMKVIRRGSSSFLGCENYPKCKFTKPILSERILALAEQTACPTCGVRPLEPRSGRYGEYLYCPQCKANLSLRKLGLAGRTETVEIACPECGNTPLEKRRGRWGPYYHCPHCEANIPEKKLSAALPSADD